MGKVLLIDGPLRGELYDQLFGLPEHEGPSDDASSSGPRLAPAARLPQTRTRAEVLRVSAETFRAIAYEGSGVRAGCA